MMQAVVCDKYGPPEVLALKSVPRPTPGDREVLIRIHATAVNSGDWRVRSLEVPPGFGLLTRLALGLRRPRQPVLGTELSGVIEAVGKHVRKLAVGAEVVGFAGVRMGCHAEYRCLPEDGAVVAKPANLSHEEAAAIPFGAITALDFLRRGKLKSGERVLINGASGAVGVALVQLSRHLGAEVTAVCSAKNADLVRSLGAAHVIDYTRDDFTANGAKYDVIADTAGTAPFSRCKGSLAPGGRLLLILGGLADLLSAPWQSLVSGKKIIAGPAAEKPEDLRYVMELAAAGHYRAVIDRRYPLAQIVDAHRYVDAGHKRGSVVITLGLTPD